MVTAGNLGAIAFACFAFAVVAWVSRRIRYSPTLWDDGRQHAQLPPNLGWKLAAAGLAFTVAAIVVATALDTQAIRVVPRAQDVARPEVLTATIGLALLVLGVMSFLYWGETVERLARLQAATSRQLGSRTARQQVLRTCLSLGLILVAAYLAVRFRYPL